MSNVDLLTAIKINFRITTTKKDFFIVEISIAKDFRTITTTKTNCVVDFLTIFVVDFVIIIEKSFRIATTMKKIFYLIVVMSINFKRLNKNVMLRIIFSYFRIKFITSSNSKMFFQSSFSKS